MTRATRLALALSVAVVSPLVVVFLLGATDCTGYAVVSGDSTPSDPANQCRSLSVGDDVILSLHTTLTGDDYVRARDAGELQRRGVVQYVDEQVGIVGAATIPCAQISHVHRKRTALQCGAREIASAFAVVQCLVAECPWRK